MELGLSLGDSSKPLIGLMEKHPHQASKELGLGFNTTLSIGPIISTTQRDQLQQQQQEEEKTQRDINNNSNRTENPNPVLHQLDLLPQLSFPWNPPSQNGNLLSTEFGGSSRGLDVNVVPPATVVVMANDEMALSSSRIVQHLLFRRDLCMYSRGGSGGRSLSGSGGNKREFSDGEGYDQRNSSRVSDEDDNCGVGNGNTRKKLRLSKDQSAFLEESFKEHHTLNPKQKLALAKQLNLRPRQVEVWFQNRRARTKLKQTEVDCEYLKRCCETLTEENRRLHKELQELRALKTSNPFNMQLPATTLTMCPSCERVATNSTATSSVTNTSATINGNNNNKINQ
uniref:Type II homeodomain-leucine zipper protein n=1 Tax=Medicago sativa TaxID=3879 RepID=Q45RR3_MEDSA|nr:type II homeodomain-leucine zipper protein [Medicago sativa]